MAISLALIGGTGCITTAVVSDLQRQAAQREYEARQRKDFEADRTAAAQGDPAALMRVGLEYVAGQPLVARDLAKGISLLEQAVAQQYAPAEYALGSLLLSGRSDYRAIYVAPDKLARDPARGIALLKLSATRACVLLGVKGVGFHRSPAYEVSSAYRRAIDIDKDQEQADLWLARSIVHCGEPKPYRISGEFFSRPLSPHDRIDALAFLLLMPDSSEASSLKAAMPEADIQRAQQRAAQLRQLVAASEAHYPRPLQGSKQ